MKKAFELIDKALEWAIILGMSILVIVCMFAVIFRYAGFSLFWADEFMRYLFINVLFLGCPLLVYKKSHIMVDITEMILSTSARRILTIINDVLFIVLGSVLVIYTIPMVTINANSVSSAMSVPMIWVILCMRVGFFMVAVNGLRLLIEDIKPAI